MDASGDARVRYAIDRYLEGCPDCVGRAAIQTVNDMLVQTTSQPMDDWAGWEWRTLHAVFASCNGLDESEGCRDANAVRMVLMCIDAEVM